MMFLNGQKKKKANETSIRCPFVTEYGLVWSISKPTDSHQSKLSEHSSQKIVQILCQSGLAMDL